MQALISALPQISAHPQGHYIKYVPPPPPRFSAPSPPPHFRKKIVGIQGKPAAMVTLFSTF